MVLLLLSEFSYYRTTLTETHLVVDTSSADVDTVVDTHITFFHATCASIDVHFRDHKGKEVDDAHIIATRVPWFGDETGHARREGEGDDGNGCSIATTIVVPKVRSRRIACTSTCAVAVCALTRLCSSLRP